MVWEGITKDEVPAGENPVTPLGLAPVQLSVVPLRLEVMKITWEAEPLHTV
jgi:hypothetical protein